MFTNIIDVIQRGILLIEVKMHYLKVINNLYILLKVL